MDGLDGVCFVFHRSQIKKSILKPRESFRISGISFAFTFIFIKFKYIDFRCHTATGMDVVFIRTDSKMQKYRVTRVYF